MKKTLIIIFMLVLAAGCKKAVKPADTVTTAPDETVQEEMLTAEEWKQGYHYCLDWDGLFIGPDDIEFECCTCHPLKRKDI